MCGCYTGKRQAFLVAMFLVLVCGSAQATLKFSNASLLSAGRDNSRFKVSNASRIIQQPSNMTGISIINGNLGLKGDLVLKENMQLQFDFCRIDGNGYSIILDADWTIPANTALHLTGSSLIEGNGNNLIIGENAQLFVDTNASLTLRNINVKSSKNGVGNPAIKLASTGSKLTLDSAKLDFANDFYFDRGSLFAYNDVNFSGTNAFIYRSTVPSYIKSGANLKFNTGTSFDYRPSTTGVPGLLAKDLFIFDDADSKLTFDGASLKTTLTGMRLSRGQVLFDNKVSLTSQVSLNITPTLTNVYSNPFGSSAWTVDWRPDGRYLAVGGDNGATDLIIYSFDGVNLNSIVTVSFVSYPWSVNWSPDGKYLAVGGVNGSNGLIIYSFDGRNLNPIATKDLGTTTAVRWSPDGRYLAVGVESGATNLIIYSFDGLNLSQIATQSSTAVYGVNWSPDGKYLAAGGLIGSSHLVVYSFNGQSLTQLDSRIFYSAAYAVKWSPDGRSLAVGIYNGPYPDLIVYSFNGSLLSQVASVQIGTVAYDVDWSPDGRYLAVGGSDTPNYFYVYSYDGKTLTKVIAMTEGIGLRGLAWSPAGNYLATGFYGATNNLVVYRFNFGSETLTQAVSNSIVFGNSSLGSASDINLKLLSGANVSVDGILNYDNVLGGTIFSNDNARFVLKDSNSMIRMNPNTVVGWQDRSLIKNMTGKGLGDYNLQSYDTNANKIVTYAESPGELVYDNSNAIVAMNGTIRTNSNAFAYGIKNNSNAIIKIAASSSTLAVDNSNAIVSWIKQTSNTANYLSIRVRTDSNAFAYGIKNNSNAIINISAQSAATSTLARTTSNAFVSAVKIYNTQQIYSSHATVENLAWYKAGFDVRPGKILALKTPLAMTGQISLGGTLTLSSDMFMDAGTTFSSYFGFGQINGNNNAIHLTGNLTVSGGSIMRIGSNLVMEGNGNTILLGDNSQLFVDDNVTLTLRNVVIKSSKNGAGNPAIKLASTRSQLALDNTKLDFADDFYFDRGKLFAYNDVNFSGTNAFIYRSTVPSYIKSGANLKFNVGTSFDFMPSTTGTPGLLAKDLFIFDDVDSKLIFDSASLKTTLTGMRLTRGQLLFDNKISITSQALLALVSTGSWVGRDYPGWINSINWSPDGRFVAAGCGDPGAFGVYRFTGSSLQPIVLQDYGTDVNSIDWSPDGKYLAICGDAPSVGHDYLEIYKFTGTSLSRVTSVDYGDTAQGLSWSPDGRYLAIGGTSSALHEDLEIYSFDGVSLTRVVSQVYGALVRNIDWNPDGKYLAIAGTFPTTGHGDIEVYSFTGSSLSLVCKQNYGNFAWSLNWSPDGKTLVVGGQAPSSGNEIQVFAFTGSSLALLDSRNFGSSSSYINSVNWSPDGRYFVVAGRSTLGYDDVDIFSFENSTISPVASVNNGFDSLAVNWSSDGKFLAVGGDTPPASEHSVIEVYTLQYGPETQTQAVSNSIVLGNSAAGPSSDLNVKLLSGANVSVDGILNYDNVNSTSIFSNEDARFVLKDNNSMVRMNPSTVVGWNDRSLIKNLTGAGLGDYNLKTYDTNANGLVTYAEAPTELVYNNSNAIIKFNNTTDALVVANSNAIKYLSDHFITINNGKVTVLGGINGTTNVAGRGLLSSPIDLQGGTLTLNSDMILSNQTTVVSSGNFDLQGNAMIFGGDLSLPGNVAIKIVSSGVLDGQGNELRNLLGSKLIVDNNVTLTLRNMNWVAVGSPQIEMRAATSKLTLQNTALAFDRDYSFTQGQLFIQDDVFVTGTNKFSYVSTTTSYVMLHSTLYFDKNTTFSYSPRVTSRHTRSERNLIKLLDNTSEIYFNECTLQLPDSGWQLTNGTIYFDNKVIVNGNTTQADSFEWGNGIAANDLNVEVLAGAWLDNYAYIYHNSAN